MRTKTIKFSFAYQYAEYDELVKEIIEKMYNVGLDMAKDKNMAICYEGEESEKKTYNNDYETVMHLICEKQKDHNTFMNPHDLENVHWTVTADNPQFRNGKDVDLGCKGL